MYQTPELLAPAGSFEKLKMALHYGADAVYMGLSDFSLRAKADNFTEQELEAAIEYAHKKKKKVYITINIFPHNDDIKKIKKHLYFLRSTVPDGIVISDLGVFEIISKIAPEIPVHVSTQANITNYEAAKFWERLGVKRLVLSRELSIDEISEIRRSVSIELECFVHGSICISYSGRCFLSSFLTNRSANKGECTNSCRWNYTLMEEKRTGEYFPIYENDKGTYILSSRDICMIKHLDKLVEIGIDSFKIEGRMKGINYVSGVVKTYRDAIDSLGQSPYTANEQWIKELSMFSSRGFTEGMYFGMQSDSDYNHDEDHVYRMSHELVGIVRSIEDGNAMVSLRNTLKTGDRVNFLSSGLENKVFEVAEIKDLDNNIVTSGKNEDIVIIPIHKSVRENDLIRRSLS